MRKIEVKKRINGKGSAIFLGDNRGKSWGARITLGKDKNGVSIRHYIGTFETELDALVCLETYHKNPTPIYIQEDKYNRIVTFSKFPYPLIPVENPKKEIVEQVKIENYTFKQLFEKFKETKMLTKEEEKLEKIYHIRPKNKPYSRGYCQSMTTAYHNSKGLYNKVYKELRTSDFMNYIKESKKGPEAQRMMVNLYRNLDKFALEEDIIEKGYSQFITSVTSKRKEIKKITNAPIVKDKIFSYEQINYLWNLKPRSNRIKERVKTTTRIIY